MRTVALTAAACAAVVLAACSPAEPPKPQPASPEALAAYLREVLAANQATRQRELAGWQLDAPLWRHTVTAVYQPIYADYQQAFTAALPGLAAQLDQLARSQPAVASSAAAPAVTARRHYAGDPRLTLAQSRDRWALPPLFPSLVAEVNGAPIDAVFVADGDRWRVLVGLDAVVQARVAALDAACAGQLARAGRTGRCTDVGAAIADAALRNDRERLAHVCRLADSLCGK